MLATQPQQKRWLDACLIAKIICIDPAGLGGVWLRASAGPTRDLWFDILHKGIAGQVPVLKVPHHTDEIALLGGLDLLQTLQYQKRMYTKGILSQAAGGIIHLAMAERLRAHTVGLISQAFDTRQDFGVIAVDEAIGDEEQLSPRLRDRLAFQISLDDVSYRHCQADISVLAIASARVQLGRIVAPELVIEALVTAAQSLGIHSLRAVSFALRASRAIAALRGAQEISQEDITTATRMVFSHRLTTFLQTIADDTESAPDPDSAPSQPQAPAADSPAAQNPESAPQSEPYQELTKEQLQDMMIAASQAYIPPDLLASMSKPMRVGSAQENSQGKVGQLKKGLQRGQSLASRPGKLDRSKKLDLLKTIQAASPWQTIRRLESGLSLTTQKIKIHPADIHLKNYVQRSTSVTIFVVDASGSSALERLGEAKGAVELLLAQCYVRRDQVALLTFRANQVDLVLSPTRSLVRAKRLLAAMPGGGGTPLAKALQSATQFAVQLKRKGQTPLVVLMTDGRANVTLAGLGGREQANTEAVLAAQRMKLAQFNCLFVDTSFKTQETNQTLAAHMGAHYILLPRGKSSAVVQAARQLLV